MNASVLSQPKGKAAGVEPLEEVFDQTAAFEWLVNHARDFGFSMSYPRDNPQRFLYEPWHWCFHEKRRADLS